MVVDGVTPTNTSHHMPTTSHRDHGRTDRPTIQANTHHTCSAIYSWITTIKRYNKGKFLSSQDFFQEIFIITGFFSPAIIIKISSSQDFFQDHTRSPELTNMVNEKISLRITNMVNL